MPRVVAIDLGSANVKASVWNVNGRKVKFQERIMQPVITDDAGGSSLEDRLEALQVLLGQHAQLKAAGTIIGASFGGRNVSVHQITLPFTDKKKIEKTLPFVVEGEVPFDMDEMVLAWRILSKTDTTEAIVALSDEAALRATIEGLGAHKMEPRQIAADKELLVAWGLTNEPLVDETPRTKVVLDIGHSRTLLVAVQGKRMIASRVIDVGGADFTRAIQQGLGCSWANAQRLKHDEAVLPDPESEFMLEPAEAVADDGEEEDVTDQGGPLYVSWDTLPNSGYYNLPDDVRTKVDAIGGQLLAEVRSTLIGFEDVYNIDIDEVRIGGGGARLEPLVGWLYQDLGVAINWASNPDGTTIPCEFMLSDALGGYLSGDVDVDIIDLRSGALAYRSGFNALGAILMYGGALVLFFTLAMVGMYGYQTWALGSQITETQARIENTIAKALPGAKIKRPKDAMEKMRKHIDEANDRAHALGSNGKPPTIDLIHEISSLLPGPTDLEIDITSLKATPKSLTFDAEVPTYAAASQVETALQSEPRFANCTKSNEQQRRKRILFTMQCDLTAPDDNGEG
ncbi:MAG: Tfp pilus assembly PilM family ATPase [Kiritimatiellia bacterium]|jgi:Tfp pilus assembly PilM family ATPase